MFKKLFIIITFILLIGINYTTLRRGDWTFPNIDLLQTTYEHSQYCVPNCEFRGNIDDPELYTLAGYRYVQGISPKDLNPELQPLTKYLYGIAIHLFGSPLFAQVIIGLASLFILILMTKIFLPEALIFIPAILLSLDPLFMHQLIHPYLDLSVTMWGLLILYLLTKQHFTRIFFLLGTCLGALALSKSFSHGILAAILISPVFSNLGYQRYLKTLITAMIVYIIGYLPLVLKSGLLSLLSLHLEILRFYHSYVPEYPKGEIFRIIFTAQWRSWWGDKGLIPSPFYTWLWPIAVITSIISLAHKGLRQLFSTHLAWVFLELLFISLRLVFPRYLLPILPSLYLLLTTTLYRIISSCLLVSSASISKPIVT